MTLQPAHEVVLSDGGHTITLRASLRAVAALDALPGGLAAMWSGVMRQRFTEIRQVLLATATDKAGARILLAPLSDKPLVSFLGPAQAACLELFTHLLPEPSETASEGQGMTWADLVKECFGYGTGWLGWSSRETWDATPAEIMQAMTAKIAFQNAMNGTPPDDDHAPAVYTPERLEEIEEQGFDPAFDREGLKALKARHT